MKAFLTAVLFFAFLPVVMHVVQLGEASSGKAFALKNGVMLQQALAEKAYAVEAGFKHAVVQAASAGRDVCAALEEWTLQNGVNVSAGFFGRENAFSELSECGDFLEFKNATSAAVKCRRNESHCEWLNSSTPGFLLQAGVRGLPVRVFLPKGTVVE